MDTQETLRAIIETFTPSSLEESVQQIKALSLNDPRNLNYLSNLILQKVDMAADMSKECAKLCACLQEIDVFKVVLVDNCQTAFATVIDKHTLMKLKHHEFSLLNDKPSDEEENKLRCSTTRLCSFIGELFLLEVLASKAVCQCINVLLTMSDDFSLDYLCILLGTCGKQLEESLREKGSKAMEVYFSSINILAEYNEKFNISNEVAHKALRLAALREKTWDIPVDVEEQAQRNQEEANKEKTVHKKEMNNRLKEGGLEKDYSETDTNDKDDFYCRGTGDITISPSTFPKPEITEECPHKNEILNVNDIVEDLIEEKDFRDEDVPLRHRAKDAWKPAIFSQDAKNMNDEEKKSHALYNSVRGILNKLTLEKFPALIQKFKALEIDTAPRLREVIKLIFQKAIEKPEFCKWYATMCQEMQHLTVPEENGNPPISFRILLLNQCQAQFERDITAELDSVTKKSEIDASTNLEKKKELQFEENELKNRRKSVENCRFIGELYKCKMLTSKITMNCIRQLLTQINEESLECLCVLLTTIGKDLDKKAVGTQTSKELDPFFKKIQDIAEKKTYKVSSQIRFMLLDVIELRRNYWVPHNLKTIGEMNIEIKKKEHEQKMLAAIATCRSYDDYGNRGRDNKQNRNSRQSNDEWQTVTKNNMSKPSYKLDPSKFSSSTQSSKDIEASSGPSSFNVWRWRSGVGASVKSSYKKSSSRGSSSRKPIPSTSMERSKQFPVFQENDTLKISRSGSIQNVPPVSRKSSVPRAAPLQTASQTAAPPPSNVPTELSEEKLRRCSATILKEYYVSKDLEDSLAAFAERFNPNQVTKVFEEFIYMVLEDPKLAEPCGKLTAALLKKKSVSLSYIISALSSIIEAAGDTVIDYPRMWEYITNMLSVIFIQDCSQYNEFEAALLKQHPEKDDHGFLSAVKTKLMDSKANATSTNEC